MNESGRGTGRTTRQMQNAPKGAVFIWCNSQTTYPKELARKLKREDLKIYSPSALEDGKLRGLELTGLIIDHYTHLTSNQWEGWEKLSIRIQHQPTDKEQP